MTKSPVSGYSLIMKRDALLGNNVRDWRKKRGLTQQKLADSTNITRQTIIMIEKQRLNPSILLALAFSQALDVPVDELFYLQEPPIPAKSTPDKREQDSQMPFNFAPDQSPRPEEDHNYAPGKAIWDFGSSD